VDGEHALIVDHAGRIGIARQERLDQAQGRAEDARGVEREEAPPDAIAIVRLAAAYPRPYLDGVRSGSIDGHLPLLVLDVRVQTRGSQVVIGLRLVLVGRPDAARAARDGDGGGGVVGSVGRRGGVRDGRHAGRVIPTFGAVCGQDGEAVRLELRLRFPTELLRGGLLVIRFLELIEHNIALTIKIWTF